MSEPADAQSEIRLKIVLDQIGQASVALKQNGDIGANWFYWIGGLSLVNTALMHSGKDLHFVVGLAVTTVVDAVARELGKQQPEAATLATGISIVFSLCVTVVVILFGWLSRKQILWVFGIGMGLYLLDGLVYLAFGDFLSAAFHGYALFMMARGFRAYRQLANLRDAFQGQAAMLQTVVVATDGVGE